ncbi:energy-coupled thiamine transporter ThiT [Vagococcus xieshaowenii]|uniref:Energy-coupled thiamine transporter ThiT n=1 Tax=Vagococcus xieshaowenii TaxID=2562451 RepID=A0AAJ5EG73_9ENTE|nr:energy-coupled thiamine transporter ThiT [Vagococcus xieshaowenii]QCA29321.1 energy-coupled thiamine transporter ThiT [Vagococcus xieshaowenii]TFZ41984.1 energy-coupled thiamine transporter ThiT [Vagococcus xieshaowenii]
MKQSATSSSKILIGVEGAIIAALAMILSFIPTTIGSSFTISLGMIPLTIYSLKRGLLPGLLSGLVWGFLHFATGQITYLSVSQVLIEYIIAFPMAGMAGLVSKRFLASKETKDSLKWLVAGVFIGTFARFFWHFVAGVVFWGQYALWGMSPILFSLVMNGGSGLATAVVTAIMLTWLYKMSPRLFFNN